MEHDYPPLNVTPGNLDYHSLIPTLFPPDAEDDDGDYSYLPPPNYTADRVARELLSIGHDLFQNRMSADCILIVGGRSYFVHVPMLSSRSPTFRKIFQEMIENKAWDTESESESDSDSDDSDDEDEPMEIDDIYPITPQNDHEIQRLSRLGSSMDQDNLEYEDDGSDHGSDDETDDESDSSSDNNGVVVTYQTNLPELTLELADPEGSYFNELLRWIYTDDGETWGQVFTLENYDSILQNLCYLNIRTKEVIEVCRRFERTVGLLGRAEEIMKNAPNQI